MNNELIQLFDRFDSGCNTVQCPACRLFCRDWVQAGKTIYRLINEDVVDDGELTLVKNVVAVGVTVIKEYESKKGKELVVSNE